MPTDISDLRATIVPRSDQLNAEQLLGGDMTITVSDVRIGTSEEQPISIHYPGEDGRPYKPCKTMRKVLIFAWGEDGRNWIGKSMTLFNDQAVRFGGMTVGGIRISHLSDIEKDINVSLTATKGKKAMHTIQRLEVVSLATVLAAIEAAKGRDGMNKAKAMAMQLTDADDIAKAQAAYAARVAALKAKPEAAKVETTDPATGEITSNEKAKPEASGPSYAVLVDRLKAARVSEDADMVLDTARHLPKDQYDDLVRMREGLEFGS